MTGNKQLSFRISKELYKKFVGKVTSEGKQSGKVLQQLVEAYIEGNIPDGSEVAETKTKEDEQDIKKLVADEVERATSELKREIEELKEVVESSSKAVANKYDGSYTKKVADDSSELEVSNDNNWFQLETDDLVRKVAHKVKVSEQLARNRIEGKPKKRLTNDDRKVLEELEKWEQVKPGKWVTKEGNN